MAAVMQPSTGESGGGSNGLGSSQNGLAVKRKRSTSPEGENGARPPTKIFDVDPERRRERERQLAIRQAEQELAADGGAVKEKQKEDPKAEIQRMALTKAGGAYIPPHRLRAIMGETAALQGNASPEFQRLSWDALRKSINGLINKVNVANIKQIVPELFQENLIRARGLYCRSIMRAQAASLPFTPVFAALTAIVNTKLPQVGELLLTRLVSQFRRSFKRNDKPSCVATSTFIAQLVNQQVAHELLVLQMLVLLLEHPTGDSVEIAVGLMREVGAFLAEAAPKANNGVFERFRAILHEGQVEKRVQYMIEVLFQVRREKFKDNPIIPEGLDLVEEDDIITHRISLDDELVTQDTLNIFKFDPNFLENEEKYKEMKREILGDSDSDESGSEGSGSEEDDEDEEDEVETGIAADGTLQIHDQTETNMVNLRRTIYLTIMSALDFEEAVHKLLKIHLPQGQESEMCNMVIECCSQERSYNKFYGLMAERLCKINRVWSIGFEGCFRTYYDTIHRYETNRLRNIAKLFGHLLASEGIPWSCLDVIKMTEEDTTSSSRIFTKIMFQEMLEEMGLPKLKKKLFDDMALQPFLEGIFPKDHPKNTRFSINFFTSIGLGALTEDMREHLKSAPALLLAQQQALADARAANGGGDSDSDSSSSSSLSSSSSDLTSSSSSSSGSESDDSRRRGSSNRRRTTRRRSSTPPPRRRRRKSYSSSSEKSVSRSPSPPPARRNVPMENPERARMRDPAPVQRRESPPPARRRRSPSVSRSPPRRRRRSPSDSRSPPPARRNERDDRDAPRDRRGGDRDYDKRDGDRPRR